MCSIRGYLSKVGRKIGKLLFKYYGLLLGI